MMIKLLSVLSVCRTERVSKFFVYRFTVCTAAAVMSPAASWADVQVTCVPNDASSVAISINSSQGWSVAHTLPNGAVVRREVQYGISTQNITGPVYTWRGTLKRKPSITMIGTLKQAGGGRYSYNEAIYDDQKGGQKVNDVTVECASANAAAPSPSSNHPVLLPNGPIPTSRGEFSQLMQIPESCQAAKQLSMGRRVLMSDGPGSLGPACQPTMDCAAALARQFEQTGAFLHQHPEVATAFQDAGMDRQAGIYLRHVIEGRTALGLTGGQSCGYVWEKITNDGDGVRLDQTKSNPTAFEFFVQAGQRFMSGVRSSFSSSEAEYRAIRTFNGNYPGALQFDNAYRNYTTAIKNDDIVVILRAKKQFSADMDVAQSYKQLVTGQTDELKRLLKFVADMNAESDRNDYVRIAKQDLQAPLSALRDEANKYVTLSEAQRGDISPKLKQLSARRTEIESMFQPVRAERARLEGLDARRKAVLGMIDLALAPFSAAALQSSFTEEAKALAKNLTEKRVMLKRLESIKLVDRPDYTKDLEFAESAAAQLRLIPKDLSETNQFAEAFTTLKSKIDARGRNLLDSATVSEVNELYNSVKFFVEAKVPFTEAQRTKLAETSARLEKLLNSIDDVMDMGALSADARALLTANPQLRTDGSVETAIEQLYKAKIILDYCDGQSWFGGKFSKNASEAQRRAIMLEDIFVHVQHHAATEINKIRIAVEDSKSQIQYNLKWNRNMQPEKMCEGAVLEFRLDRNW